MSKTIAAPTDLEMKNGFEHLIEHVGAHEDDNVFVLWHDTSLPALSMTLSVCRNVFELLITVWGQEMHIFCPQRGWYLEFDPFFDECHGGKKIEASKNPTTTDQDY